VDGCGLQVVGAIAYFDAQQAAGAATAQQAAAAASEQRSAQGCWLCGPHLSRKEAAEQAARLKLTSISS
jgi:hypothetical protein